MTRTSQWTPQDCVREALSLGCEDARIIPTKSIMLGHWVKLQCQFGCPHFATRFTCPPLTPSCDDTSDILMDYKKALIIRTRKAGQVREIVLSLESRFKSHGMHKAFALCALPCDLCEVCTIETSCKHPTQARPTLQACGIDVPQTFSHTGWEVQPFESPCSEAFPFGMVLMQ